MTSLLHFMMSSVLQLSKLHLSSSRQYHCLVYCRHSCPEHFRCELRTALCLLCIAPREQCLHRQPQD